MLRDICELYNRDKFRKNLIKSVPAAVMHSILDCVVIFKMDVDNMNKPKKHQKKKNRNMLLACRSFIYCIYVL